MDGLKHKENIMTPPKTTSTKNSIKLKLAEVERLEKLARLVVLPFARLLDYSEADETGAILVSEKIMVDTEKAWIKFQDAYKKVIAKKSSDMPEKPQRVYTRPDPFPPKKSVGESKSRGKVTSDAEGSTTGP
jgi:hypothetical protein